MADRLNLRNCKKSPSQGGFSREQANEVARTFGIDPKKFSRKDDLCNEIVRVAATQETQTETRTPARRPTQERAITREAPVQPLEEPTPEGEPVPPLEHSNQEIADVIERLADYHAKRRDGVFRARTFRNAAQVIRNFPQQLTGPEQLKGIKGIGEGTIQRLYELFASGQITEPTGFVVGFGIQPEQPGPVQPRTITIQETPHDKAYKELITIFGIGGKTAESLIAQGIMSFDDLIDQYNAGNVNLTAAQKLGLEYYNHFKERIPREEVEAIGNYIVDIVEELGGIGEIVGSYRRGKPTSGDVDVLITDEGDENVLDDVIKRLVKDDFIEHVVSHGPVKFQGTYWSSYPEKDGVLRKVDIRFVPFDDWAASLLHSTGSDRHNIMLRNKAIAKNYTLSEHGLIDNRTNQRIPVASEEDVFEALGMEYVPPSQRD